MFKVGDWVQPTQSDTHGGGYYTQEKVYQIIKTTKEWIHIERNDGSGLIGVNRRILKHADPPIFPPYDPDFTLEEIELAETLING